MNEIKDNNGLTAEEWGKNKFEFEYCSECGGDWNDHDYILLQSPYHGESGCWFARCRDENIKYMEDHPDQWLLPQYQ